MVGAGSKSSFNTEESKSTSTSKALFFPSITSKSEVLLLYMYVKHEGKISKTSSDSHHINHQCSSSRDVDEWEGIVKVFYIVSMVTFAYVITHPPC